MYSTNYIFKNIPNILLKYYSKQMNINFNLFINYYNINDMRFWFLINALKKCIHQHSINKL